ncbi:MAG TPA: nuclear transport factor 2 family protein [Candidatus Krumholzibacteria bacterium]|nr:nuclear transport factor 2 family protein [Candidatus Krumholzibacteria bacterium]
MSRIFLVPSLLLMLAAPAFAQTASQEDLDAIKATALDYAEGWYTGDAARMEKAVSPDLAKRIVRVRDGRSYVDNMTAMTLVQNVRSGRGTRTPKDQQQADVTILDVFGNAASVKVVMSGWIDYLHEGKVDGHWVIINVLWELKPQTAK